MGRRFENMSLAGQIFAIIGAGLVVTAAAALAVAAGVGGEFGALLRLKLIGVLCIGAAISIALVMVATRRLLLEPLEHLDAHLTRLMDGRLEPAGDAPMRSRELKRVKGTFDRMVGHLTTARAHFEDAQRVLATRTSTVDRLLDFSQTIQGAGRVEQVFESLAHYLRTELTLAGAAIISNQPQ